MTRRSLLATALPLGAAGPALPVLPSGVRVAGPVLEMHGVMPP